MFRTLVASAVLALFALSGAVSAATVNFSSTPIVVLDNPDATSTTGTFFDGVTGSINNVRRSPWQGTSLNSTGTYTSITGTATYVFAGMRNVFSLVWGSPDRYNSLAFFLGSSAIPVFTITGSDFVHCCGSNVPNALVTISGLQFDKVVFRSTTPAFEYSNVMATVPVPAAGGLLLAALGGMAALRRRKRA